MVAVDASRALLQQRRARPLPRRSPTAAGTRDVVKQRSAPLAAGAQIQRHLQLAAGAVRLQLTVGAVRLQLASGAVRLQLAAGAVRLW
jgi:hypothetical protein